MNLLQLTFSRLLVPLLLVLLAWSVVLYVTMRSTVYNDLDEALSSRMHDLSADPRLPVVDHSRDTLRSGTDLYLEAITPAEAAHFSTRFPAGRFSDTLLYDRTEQEDEPFRKLTFVKSAEGHHHRFTLLASLVNTEELLMGILFNVVLLIAVVLVTVLVIERTLLRRLWAPFHEALERIRSYRADGHVSGRFSTTPVREFQELQRSLDDLMRVNSEQYALQKEFTDNAAHELHTPIAIAHAKLEELLMLPGLTAEQAALLGPAVESLDRLSAVNKGLLLLARIDNQSVAQVAAVSIAEVVQHVLAEQEAVIEFRKLRVELQEAETLAWRMNPDLAHVLVGNLLRNAIGHNTDGGWLCIWCGDGKLVLENSGAPLKRASEELMARFAHSGGTGTGLGLAIVHRIALRYGLHMSYSESNGTHRVVVSEG